MRILADAAYALAQAAGVVEMARISDTNLKAEIVKSGDLSNLDLSDKKVADLLIREGFGSINQVWFNDANCSRVMLNKLSISSSEFRGANLTNGYFRGSTIVGCSFRKAAMVDANLNSMSSDKCDFREADLRHADLESSSFAYCDFRGAKLHGAKIRRTAFTHCVFDRCWRAKDNYLVRV